MEFEVENQEEKILVVAKQNGKKSCATAFFKDSLEFEGKKVPDVLLSGNHAEIRKWRYEKSLEITRKRRPDLLNEEEFS